MKEYTITPINTGMVNSNKANYLYHNSTHKYYDVEGPVHLPLYLQQPILLLIMC